MDIPKGSVFQVWWIPQIPMESFTYTVESIETGIAMLDMLAKYDLFQLEKSIKPDYSNTGGLRWKHEEVTGGSWWDFDEDDFND